MILLGWSIFTSSLLMNDSGISDTIILLTDDQQKDEEGKKKGKYHRRNPRNFHIFTLNAKSLGGNVSF